MGHLHIGHRVPHLQTASRLMTDLLHDARKRHGLDSHGPFSLCVKSLSAGEFLVDLVVVEGVFNRCVGRDMITDRHDETRALFSDIHAALYFSAYLFAGSPKKDARVGVADEGMCPRCRPCRWSAPVRNR